MDEKKAVAEAALFLSEEPLDTDELADVMNLGSKGFVQQVIDELQEDLDADARGLTIVESEEGYEMVVKTEHVEQVEHLAPHRDLNEAELRTLALIAYNAPVKQSDVVDVRGNRAYGQIKELTRRGFIQAEQAGRTKELDVTDHFLDYFDLDTPDEFAMQAEEEHGGWDTGEDGEDGGEAQAEDAAEPEEPDAEESEPVQDAGDGDGAEDAEDEGPTRITDPVVPSD